MAAEIQTLKQQAAQRAISLIQSGMVVGLGTGSTAIWATRGVAELLRTGELHDIVAIPTSAATDAEATRLNIPLTTLEEHPVIDVSIDGADEVDPQLNVIKGGGGALLREKIVAQASKRLVIIVDESKPTPRLGTTWSVPVEVISFGWGGQQKFLESLGAKSTLRLDASGNPFITDHGNLIIDCNFGPIADLHDLAQKIHSRTGIVEHGLFLGMVTDLIIASPDGIQQKRR